MPNNKYKLVDRTPEEMRCGILAGCPTIYEVTPEKMRCAIIGCESIYSDKENNTYLIVGRQVNPEDFGLAKKVGQGEILIQVPRDLIDKMRKD